MSIESPPPPCSRRRALFPRRIPWWRRASRPRLPICFWLKNYKCYLSDFQIWGLFKVSHRLNSHIMFQSVFWVGMSYPKTPKYCMWWEAQLHDLGILIEFREGGISHTSQGTRLWGTFKYYVRFRWGGTSKADVVSKHGGSPTMPNGSTGPEIITCYGLREIG